MCETRRLRRSPRPRRIRAASSHARNVRGRAETTGSAKIVPSDARIAFGLNGSVRGSAAMTASAPAAVRGASTALEVAGLLDALDDHEERIVRAA